VQFFSSVSGVCYQKKNKRNKYKIQLVLHIQPTKKPIGFPFFSYTNTKPGAFVTTTTTTKLPNKQKIL